MGGRRRWTIAEPHGSVDLVWSGDLSADERAAALPGGYVASMLGALWSRVPTWQAAEIASFLGHDAGGQHGPREPALKVVARALTDGVLVAFRRGAPARHGPASGGGPAPVVGAAPPRAAARPPAARHAAETEPVYGVSALRAPKLIASGAETVDIQYVIEDDVGVISGGKLELFSAEGTAPIWSRPLGAGDLAPGDRKLPWDGGGVPVSERFPDGFVTLEGSPYRFKISVEGSGRAKQKVAESAPLGVEIHTFTVALAPRACLEDQDDAAVCGQIGQLSGSAPIRVMLDGNVFAFAGEHVGPYDDVGHESYWKQQRRGAGPRIPLIATILVKDSHEKPARAGKAIGRARVAWDYRDAGRASAGPPKAAAYEAKVAAYKRDDGEPAPSDNAHRDFGGKRGTGGPALPPVLGPGDDWVHDFPFKAEAGAKRHWAAFAAPLKSGPRAGDAGVVFRPAITAGDNYLLTAHVDPGGILDVKTPVKLEKAGALRSFYVGTFEVWRRVTLAKLVKKTPYITTPVPAVQSYFGDAYVDIPYEFAEIEVLTKAKYDELFAHALERAHAPSTILGAHALDRSRSQYDLLPLAPGPLPFPPVIPTPWVVTFRSYDDFKHQIRKTGHLTETDLNAALVNAGLVDPEPYAHWTEEWAHRIAMEITRALAGKAGVTVVQFEHLHSLYPDLTKRIGGVAVPLDSLTRNRQRTAFVQFDSDPYIFAHELGHCLFLPHAPTAGPLAGTIMDEEPERHDAADRGCVMSYSDEITGFCGQCLLRLRGWNGQDLDSHGVKGARGPSR